MTQLRFAEDVDDLVADELLTNEQLVPQRDHEMPVLVDEFRDVLLGLLEEFLELKPEWNSLARIRAAFPSYYGNPQFQALAEKTVDLGLRRAGLPEE